MKLKTTTVSVGILVALLIGAAPAAAQVQAHRNEIQVYAGELFGDDLTGKSISGQKPKLDDDFTYGVRYGYDVSESWGLEVSAGYSSNLATRVPDGDINLDLGILDVDGVWHFAPGARSVGYAIFGAGYALASLDNPIRGLVGGSPVAIGDDSGVSLNAGIGAKFFLAKVFIVRVEARYRFIDGLVDTYRSSLNTVETTGGVGWTF